MKKIPKAANNDFLGRFREIVSDPNNVRIPRVDHAGFPGKDERFDDPFVFMHNGIRVLVGKNGYYDSFSHILSINRGVHEPQEEYAFSKVLEHVNPELPMLELGAYWGFYSLWYKHHCQNADVYLMEPQEHNLQVGKNNFALNNQKGHFVHNFIGEGGMDVIQFLDSHNISKLSILHADIQGAEGHLMGAIAPALDEKRIEFLFISTHSQQLHENCVEKLERHKYKILGSADYDNETFSNDGIIVACLPEKPIEPFELYSRTQHSIDSTRKIEG